MIILGLDPGTAITGWGVIKYENFQSKLISYGTIETPSKIELAERLTKIYDVLTEIINFYHPEEVAIEKLFFTNNQKTAMSVGQARGVILLSCFKNQIKIFEYTPLEVKSGITGNGKASKKEVQYMVRAILGLDDIPKPDDAADALAIAIGHAHRIKFDKIKY